jgi:hypothetical protein
MIAENIGALTKLAEDAALLVLAPFLFLCFGLANAMLPYNRSDRGFRTRLVLGLAVLLCVFAVCTVIVQDRAILIGVWRQNPVLYSLVYLICSVISILVLGALIHWKLRPKLWRSHSGPNK